MTSQHSGRDSQPNLRDHAQGPENAPVTLLEYGDFQCPHCAQAYPVVKQLKQEFGDDLRFVFRHFPLVQIHEYAEIAAEAAEAAGRQGRFWEMHDFIYENQPALGPDLLLGAATELGLDVARFLDEVNGHVYAPRIRADVESGLESGVHGTPTFVINGVLHQGARDFESLLDAIRTHLKRRAA